MLKRYEQMDFSSPLADDMEALVGKWRATYGNVS